MTKQMTDAALREQVAKWTRTALAQPVAYDALSEGEPIVEKETLSCPSKADDTVKVQYKREWLLRILQAFQPLIQFRTRGRTRPK